MWSCLCIYKVLPPIADKYCEEKLKRTLKRELKSTVQIGYSYSNIDTMNLKTLHSGPHISSVHLLIQ